MQSDPAITFTWKVLRWGDPQWGVHRRWKRVGHFKAYLGRRCIEIRWEL